MGVVASIGVEGDCLSSQERRRASRNALRTGVAAIQFPRSLVTDTHCLRGVLQNLHCRHAFQHNYRDPRPSRTLWYSVHGSYGI